MRKNSSGILSHNLNRIAIDGELRRERDEKCLNQLFPESELLEKNVMQETTAKEHRENRITRKNLLSSLLIGFVLGTIAGIPVGWFTHRVFAQQRAAQVLLCRQQNFGLPEADLQARCGNVY